jgi:hypothetical protein
MLWLLLACSDDVLDSQDPTVLQLETAPLLVAPSDPTENSGVESCSLVDETRNVEGITQICAPWDPATLSFPQEVPVAVTRAFTQDRYHDRYFLIDGSGLNFRTVDEMPAGTPESVWGSAEQFDHWDDWGDAAYYTGWFLYAAAHRYATTGTAADHDRMVDLVERQLLNWRVSGAPGAMFRAPFAMLEQGIAVPTGQREYNLHEHKDRSNHVIYALDDNAQAWLPTYYRDGVDVDGTHYATVPTAEGSPSLDAYSGGLLGLTHAWDLLDDQNTGLRDEITETVRCHLNRYKKLRIRNVQSNPEVTSLIGVLTQAGTFTTDSDDFDIGGQDTLYGYVMEAVPPQDGDDSQFEWGCAEGPPRAVDPQYDFDASSSWFLADILALGVRLTGAGDQPIDFVYFTSIRGADAAYMIHLAVTAWALTGDDRYLEMLRDDLIGEQFALELVNTLGNFQVPDFCEDWIGTDLVHPVIQATIARLGFNDDLLSASLERALREEFRFDQLSTDGQSWFMTTYASVADAAQDPALEEDLDAALADLSGYIQSEGFPFDPKRALNRDYVAAPESWTELRYPTPEEIDVCEQDLEVLGIVLEGEPIDPDDPINATAVPAGRRLKENQIWHFTPYRLHRDFGSRHQRTHESFIDWTVPTWFARSAGQLDDHEGMVLAWQEVAESSE